MTTPAHDNFLEYYQNSHFAPYVVESRSAGASPINIIKASQPAGDVSDPPLADMVLVMGLDYQGPITRELGAGTYHGSFRSGDFDLVPPNTASKIVCHGHHRTIFFALPFTSVKQMIADELPDFAGDLGGLHAAPFRDTRIERLCWQLWRESATGNPLGNLFADGALLSIVAALLDAAQARTSVSDRTTVYLSAAQMRLLDEWIDLHCDEQVTLSILADLTKMPQTTFSRAFKLTTGQTPYQYVIDRRLSRARQWLGSGKETLAEIAYRCGFSSQQHMTNLFTRRLGISPAKYQQEVQE